MDQPGEVTKPARGQLNKENEVSLQTDPWWVRIRHSMYCCLHCAHILFIWVHVHPCTFTAVPTNTTKITGVIEAYYIPLFFLYGYM